MMNRYLSRITSSARGEIFNPLLWPFLIATAAYGVGFGLILPFTNNFGTSSLYVAMNEIDPTAPVVWGIAAIITIIGGITFLMFNIPPFGKISGLIGFALWLWAGWCYTLTGNYITLVAIVLPNAWFWFWQYLSLSSFRREDARDALIMELYKSRDFDSMSSDK